MTENQARALLPGTVVMWEGDRDYRGTVRQVDARGIYIDWEKSPATWMSYPFMDQVSIWTPEVS